MPTAALTNDLRRVSWACLSYWDSEPLPQDQRSVCYEWVEGEYRTRFGGTFHQSRLAALAKLGLLVPGDTARGGGRRYYRLADPAIVREMVSGLTV